MSCCAPAKPGAVCRTPDGRDIPANFAERAACCAACPQSRPPVGEEGWRCLKTDRPCFVNVTANQCKLGRFPNSAGRCIRNGRAFKGVPWRERVMLKVSGLYKNPDGLPGCGCSVVTRAFVGRVCLFLARGNRSAWKRYVRRSQTLAGWVAAAYGNVMRLRIMIGLGDTITKTQ